MGRRFVSVQYIILWTYERDEGDHRFTWPVAFQAYPSKDEAREVAKAARAMKASPGRYIYTIMAVYPSGGMA